MRIVFMGTPDYVIPVLAALVGRQYDVVGVYTQPDRQAGRGRQPAPPPVKQFALERGIPVFQPGSLRRDEAARKQFASLAPDLAVVASYGLYLPAEVFELPRLKTLNVHPSLLPRHRGPSPVSTAILSGDNVTGVTLMKVAEQMDAGPIVTQRETPIGPDETAGALTARLFRMGAELLIQVLPEWEHGEIRPQPQDESQATITRRLSREDGEIDWSRPAAYIVRQVRAYSPWPGTFTYWRGRLLKIIEAVAHASDTPSSAQPGHVMALPGGGVGVAASDGILELRVIQLEGRRAASARDFIQGHRDFVGSLLDS